MGQPAVAKKVMSESTQPESKITGRQDLNSEIIALGREIFKQIDRAKPSAFDKNYWSGRVMEWSMKHPEFKVNMFRLVDVLPTLRTSSQIATHVNEYLGAVGSEISKILGWGLNVNPDSLRAKLLALIVKKSVREMASQFIAGQSPEEALKPLKRLRRNGIAFTVDLLGEFSLSEKEGVEYVDRYVEALDVFGQEIPKWQEAEPIIQNHPGESSPICISVKLSALYSQCSSVNADRSVEVLSERLSTIARRAKKIGALLYVDAEDSDNNIVVYRTFKKVFGDQEFLDFPYPGIVLQAYAKGAEQIYNDLLAFAKARRAPISIRLVKGAYWDYETIISSQNNWPSPLFSRKESSDANYEKISKLLLDNHEHTFPAFGSHNVRSLAHACTYAKSVSVPNNRFELQMLFGMADPIAKAFVDNGYLVRQYVPLGPIIPGMGYLIRRLLENTSNESFLRHTFFDSDAVDTLLKEPILRE